MKTLREVINKLFLESSIGNSNELTREKWIQESLKLVPKGARILDAGAGEQQYKKYCSHLRYVSQDFAQYFPKDLDVGLQMKKWDYGKLDIISDIASIPEADNSFDSILCTEVFEHIINPRDAIKEFSRLLKKEGILIITAPFCSLTHFAPFHYYSGFNRFFYEQELAKNNLQIIEIKENGNYFEFSAQELLRLPQIIKNYSSGQINQIERTAIKIILKMLDRVSRLNNNSESILNFGFQVLARKQ